MGQAFKLSILAVLFLFTGYTIGVARVISETEPTYFGDLKNGHCYLLTHTDFGTVELQIDKDLTKGYKVLSFSSHENFQRIIYGFDKYEEIGCF